MVLVSFRRILGDTRGNALIYVLVAVALLAALTMAMMRSGGDNAQTQNTFQTVAAIQGQMQSIRSAVQDCILTYSDGEAGYAQDNKPYPLEPDDAHLDTPQANGVKDVQYLRCPGNPGDSNDATGVYIQMESTGNSSSLAAALERIDGTYSDCEVDINYAGCTTECLRYWFIRASCP